MASIRSVFHWKYSSILIFFFYALAFAMISIGIAIEPFDELVNFSYFFLCLSLVWAIGWWLVSDTLEKKKPKPTKKQKKRNEDVSLTLYRAWQWIPIFLIILAFLSSLKLINKIALAKELNLNHGWLVAANDPDPKENPCIAPLVPKEVLKIHLGSIMAFGSNFPYAILAVDGKKELFVDRDAKNRIAISLDIRSADERIITAIENGHFTVNQNNSLDMQHPDRSTLIVRDQYKKEVLNVRYKNKANLELSALLQYPNGKTVRISKDIAPTSCIGDVGSTAINVRTR
jgi:hypothetical protein